jgi:hypothetical protein
MARREAVSKPTVASKPTLKLVHLVGTKYIDYFTDGTKTYSFLGDPSVDDNQRRKTGWWISTSKSAGEK